MPAKRKSKRSRRLFRERKKKRKGKISRFRIYIFLLILVGAFLSIKLTTKTWEKDDKLVLLTSDDSGSVKILVFDSSRKKITSFSIPSEMQVKASRQFGTWRLGGLKILSENEGYGNQLLAESLMYYFAFPIDAWASEKAEGFVEGGFRSFLSFISPYQTSLGFGDRLNLLIFSGKVKNFDKEYVDVTDFSMIQKRILTDGGEGYVLTGSFPRSVYAVFAEPVFSNSQTNIKIVDKTGSRRGHAVLGSLFESLGIKVAAITQENSEEIDCVVRGLDTKKTKHVAKLLSCEEEQKETGSFDFEFIYGEDFLKRI